MIADMVPVVREALGISSSYDAVTIPAGIKRAITFMLRTWTFPQATTKATIDLVAPVTSITLPATGVGKIKAVRLVDDSATLFKRLRRTLIGELPHSDGPMFYWQEGNLLKIDTAIEEDGYNAEVWYNNTSWAAAEAWITSDFEDILFTLSSMRLAQEMRKPEVMQVFGARWQEDAPALAQYLNEVEFNDLDIRMKPDVDPTPVARYGA